MKLMILVLYLFSYSFAATVPQNEPDYTEMFTSKYENYLEKKAEYTLNHDTELKVTEEDIKIFLYNRGNEGGQELNITNAEEVKLSHYSPEKDTVFIIHGWINDYKSGMCQVTKNAYLKAADMNVFVVDWSRIAKQEYFQARSQVIQVGAVIANMISSMERNNLLTLDKISIVGHSLGAHVAGTTGKAIKGQVHHIVGLDPAGPFFYIEVKEDRLEKSDAKFVEVLHTDAGRLGFEVSLGHADYWSNGGHQQAGCPVDDVVGTCCHQRAYLLYAESLISGKFNSSLCENYEIFESGGCKNGMHSYFGEINLNMKAQGDFFFDTNAVSPFAKGVNF